MKKVIVAISGASGAVYAQRLIQKLDSHKDVERVGVIFSTNAKRIWKEEISQQPIYSPKVEYFDSLDYDAPFASGSNVWDAMAVCPCSVATLGSIANGISTNLYTRAADVILKERRRLVLVLREMPLSLVHITNMEKATLAGAIVAPACPSFYTKPTSIDELVDTVVNRVVDLLGIDSLCQRWGSNN